jgi:hypothetical protein
MFGLTYGAEEQEHDENSARIAVSLSSWQPELM